MFDALVSLYIVYRAIQLHLPRVALARMLVNVGIEALAGAVPFLAICSMLRSKRTSGTICCLRATLRSRSGSATHDRLFLVLRSPCDRAVSIAIPVIAIIEIAKRI